MLNRVCSVLAILSLLTINAPSRDEDLEPEDVVARHVASLGKPETLAQITTRSISGNSIFKFISGATGQMTGPGQWVSEKGKMGIVLRYGGTEYPGEHFAYDGKDVMIDSVKPGQRSPLGEFLYVYNGIMKSELWGGTLHIGWPLLNLKEKGAKLKSKKRKIADRELYELEYSPSTSMRDVKVKLYFDAATFRHVMSEYRLRMLLKDTQTNYLVTEKFDDFREVDGITLPHKYSLAYLFEGGSDSLQTLHTFDVEKIGHNGKIDPRFYSAQR